MTTFTLESAAQARAVIRSQAKHLSERLNISLTAARDILAQEAYRCRHWAELNRHIDAGRPDDTCLILARPFADGFQAYLADAELALARAIGGRVLANTNLAGMLETVRYVFTQRQQTTRISDIAAALHAPAWHSAGIGPDPFAVVEAFANINGQPVKLIGTRVYLPACMNLPKHLQAHACLATRPGEPIAIMWSDPKAWLDTACAFLERLDDDSDDCPEFVMPYLPLNRAMKHHAKWFGSLMRYWYSEGRYGDEDEMFHPLVTAHGTYLVFGFPAVQRLGEAPVPTTIAYDDQDNANTLAHLNGQALRVETLAVDPATGKHLGDFPGHVAALHASLLHHPDFSAQQAGRIHIVVPVTSRDIENALSLDLRSVPGQEVFAIRTDRIDVLDDLLKALRHRRVRWFPHRDGTPRYLASLEIADRGFNGFALHLELKGDESWHSDNLVTTTDWERHSGRCRVYLELRPECLALVDAIGAKAVLDAARDGLVLRRPAGFRSSLDKPDLWRSDLAKASAPLRRKLSGRRLPAFRSMSELFARARRTVYRRDHF